MNKIKNKALFLAIVLLVVTFFSNDFGVIDIEKTAIIVAIGIDEDESGEFEISTQIATPDPASESNVLNNQTTISGKGETIAQAVDNIGKSTGWYPLLSYCQLIILGEGTLKNNVMDVLDVFIRTEKVPSSALVTTCDGKAKDILSSTSPLDNVSSFAIEKILVKQIAKTDSVAKVNVKDFACDYYGVSGCSFAPIIKKIKSDAKNSSSKEGENSDSTNLFDLTQTYIFENGVIKGKLNSEETLTFNLLTRKTLEAYLTVEGVELYGKNSDVTFNIDKFTSNKRIETDENQLTLFITLNTTLSIRDANKTTDLKHISTITEIPIEVLNKAENKIKENIESIFNKMQEEKCDVFHIKEMLFKFKYKNFESFKDEIFNTNLNVNVNCESAKG